MEPKHIKYELHLFAENVNAPASRVGELILGKAQQLCPALVATAAHNKARGLLRRLGSWKCGCGFLKQR